MKKGLIITNILLVILSFPFALFAFDEPKVLLVINEGSTSESDREFMLTQEAGVMRTILEEAGFRVVVVTESGSTVTAGTVQLKPDLDLSEVVIEDYKGIIMPCLAIPLKEPEPPNIIELVKQAVSKGLPIAAQYNSVFILAEAEVLVGKKYAIYRDFAALGDERFDGAIYMGSGVVQDGNIITSGICPFMAKTGGLTDGTPELTKLLIQLMLKK